MMEMKWVLDAQGRLAAQWNESEKVNDAIVGRLAEGRVFHPDHAGGPPGQHHGILSIIRRAVGPSRPVIMNNAACALAGSIAELMSREGSLRNVLGRTTCAVLLALIVFCGCARGQDTPGTSPVDPQQWNVHIQSTGVEQAHPAFPAEYTGPNSLTPGASGRETLSLDVMGGVRLWHGAELYGDVLVWQGYGLSNTLGMAAFPNGEAYRVGKTFPDVAVCRAYLRQTINLGGEKEMSEDDALQLRGRHDIRRLTFTIGHLSAKDLFDGNAYANDARTQFMSWSLVANTAWDYPANTLGFTNGIAAEFTTRTWSARLGMLMMSKFANGLRMDWNLAHAWGLAAEVEQRHALLGHPGAVRLFAYDQRAHMGNYQQTIDNPQFDRIIFLDAAYRYKYGFGINLDQEIRKNVGVFARLGWSDGKNQTYEFTDVDRTATGGISVKGARWRRPQDTLGIGVIVNGLSAVHRQYLAAGGLGITVGDGALDYAAEHVIEAYYNWQVAKHFQFSPDYQYTPHPAYNLARGPVNLIALRLHTEF